MSRVQQSKESSGGMSLKMKLTLMAGIPCLGLIIMSAIAIRSFETAKVGGEYYDHVITGKDLIADIAPPPAYLLESYYEALKSYHTHSKEEFESHEKNMEALKKTFVERHTFWQEKLDKGELETTLGEKAYKPAEKFYEILFNEFVPAMRAGDKTKAANILDNELAPVFEEHKTETLKALDLATAFAKHNEGEAADVVNLLHFVMLGGAAFFVLFSAIVAYLINRSVVGTLTTATEQITTSGTELNDASNQLSTASNTLSSSATEAASSLEESVASLEELSSMVKLNAENAVQAANLTQSGREAAERGEAEIQQLISSMNNIARSSKKIEDIINVIDDIAFQTNLLALNAAVEAARAGDQGKGFAVVAEAVRSLAQRSASAAKEITLLIKESVQQVEQGSSIADKSGIALNAILESTKKTAVLTQEIASATKEQAAGLDQINVAMQQLEGATQGNAASAEEVAATSAEMSAQSDSLKGLVDTLSKIVHG